MRTDSLSRLPFGNRGAVSDSLIESLRDTLAVAVPGDFSINICGSEQGFRHRTNVVRLGDMFLAAVATTPISVRRHEVPYATLRIPISGYCSYNLGGGSCIEQAGRTAVLLSGAPRKAETGGAYACAQIALDEARLTETAAAIRGQEAVSGSEALRLDRDREIELQLGAVSFDAIFRSNFALIDSLESQPQALAMLCLDDLLYRSFAMLLQPGLFIDTERDRKRSSLGGQRILDTVCGYIQAHLAEPISLTRLERISGLSRRSLQYAFMRSFSCTPVQWLREQRLVLARSLLANADCSTTVTQVAFSCGFPNSSAFSRYYLGRYGELPSTTLTRTLAR